MTRTICLCNQKGGVGKTTTAVNLSACVAAAEKKVLLIDLDPQANATSGVGIDKGSVTSSSYQLLTDEASPEELIQKTEIPTLDLIPASADLVGAEVELTTLENRERRLSRALRGHLPHYDFVVIDCPPSLGLLTLNGMTAASSLLVPVQCEYYALEGIAQLVKTIELVKSHLNRTLDIQGILLTMFDPRNNLCKQVAEEVRRHFGETVYQTVIPRNVRLSECPSFGKPIILYDVNSKGCASYFALAQEFLKREGAYVSDEKGLGEGTRVAHTDLAANGGRRTSTRSPDDSYGPDPTEPPSAAEEL